MKDMTAPLYEFVESWFFDYFCKAKNCKSQDEFIDRVWGLAVGENEADVLACCKAANDKGLIVIHCMSDVKDWLNDFAHDVVFDLWSDGLLPDKYADIIDNDLRGDGWHPSVAV